MSWTRRGVLASMAGVCGVSGCLASPDRSLPTAPTKGWNQSRCDAQKTATSDVTVPERGNLAWGGGSGRMLSVVADQTVYTVDGDDGLTALNAQTGEHRWQTALDRDLDDTEPVGVSGGIINDQLLVATRGRLYSFSTADGSERWQRKLLGHVSSISTTVVPDRQIGLIDFTHRQKYYIIAVTTESGEIKWRDSVLRGGGRGLAVFDDHVYVTGTSKTGEEVLRCLEIDTGELIWQQGIADTDRYSTHVCVTSGVLIGEGADITVYDHSDGKERASVELPHGRVRSIAVDDGTAFVLSESGLAAVSVPDGGRQWSLSRNPTRHFVRGPLAVGRESVVAPVLMESLGCPAVVVFERIDGTRRWHYTLGDDFACGTIWSQPVLADGAVFVDTSPHTVTALGDLSQQD
jgi:outer membrane protein assembly factor BamB